VGGFSQWSKIEDAAWTFENILRAEMDLAALFDHDYRCPEEIQDFLERIRRSVSRCYMLQRKELENYLLQPAAITRAISHRLEQRGRDRSVLDERNVRELLENLTDTLENEISAQVYAHKLRYYEKSGRDRSTVLQESFAWFRERWGVLETRLCLVPGKAVLSSLNHQLQLDHHINVTHATIVAAMTGQDVPEDLKEILEVFEQFAGN
jgi:septation ring formation regulator EzrA